MEHFSEWRDRNGENIAPRLIMTRIGKLREYCSGRNCANIAAVALNDAIEAVASARDVPK